MMIFSSAPTGKAGKTLRILTITLTSILHSERPVIGEKTY